MPYSEKAVVPVNVGASLVQLTSLTTVQLNPWIQECQALASGGETLERLPPPDRGAVAVNIQTLAGSVHSWGAIAATFPLMSVIKPFLLLYMLHQSSVEDVFSHVGRFPSERPYNSVLQLELDQGFPRNPMINSGAIRLAANLEGKTPRHACDRLAQWLNDQAGCHLSLDRQILHQVHCHPNWQNRALARLLELAGHIQDGEMALEIYNCICCLRGTVTDLARLGLLLAGGQPQIQTRHRQVVNALMFSCGLYERSADYAIDIGLPIKSGVSGAMVGIVPGQGAIASYSPPLDASGNSVFGLCFLRRLSQELQLSPLA
ncbi:glutaminase [Candidatus Synechococcus calcipolaris G9]|uniref:glutaminase n=1 Tax=Candidatus Synechococcus calcipolaris G9 TaxID=1497997 RepID=A0ABT6EWC0_9SYNE|nr:glutaminase [Candidatus Synechococcus calcipolaris]MDG2990071.1 glutaminase [Candidatus Synechococcus calcipolaris G9]